MRWPSSRRDDKAEALSRILDLEAPEAALIFCRTRETVDRLADTLASRGYRVEALHGGFSQQLRERVLGRLRAGANDLVIATDVAARGIDVAHLTHVFNFDLPTSAAQYVHRIGRTGRAGRSGMAVSLATRRERRLLYQIGEHTGRPVQILPVPRIEDLRERQLAPVQRASQTLAEGNLEPWRTSPRICWRARTRRGRRPLDAPRDGGCRPRRRRLATSTPTTATPAPAASASTRRPRARTAG